MKGKRLGKNGRIAVCMKAMKKLLVIDGNSILNRAFYGIRPLTTRDGLFTNAVYGVVSIISRHMEALQPDYAAVAFDLRAPTFRHLKYDGYKANRKGMPEELAQQLPYAKDVLSHMGIHILEKEGYEADDILGTLSALAKERGCFAYVLTGDRDSLQLISDSVNVLLASTGETTVFDREKFFEKYGVRPEQFVDVKALMGDSSDNIPGVAGVGEKTALKLIAAYGSLDHLYENLDTAADITKSVKEKLAAGKESAYLSQMLARIVTDVPVDRDLSAYEYHGIDRENLKKDFERLEFTAFIKKYIGTEETAAEAIRYDDVTLEFLNSLKGKTVAVAIDADGHTLYAVPCTEDGHYLCKYGTLTDLSDFFSNNNIVTENAKHLYALTDGIDVNVAFDLALAAYVLDSSDGNYTIDRLSAVYLKDTGILPAAKDAGDFPGIAADIAALHRQLSPKISDSSAKDLYFDAELPLAEVLYHMERAGFSVDTTALTAFGEKLDQMQADLTARIYVQCGEVFNLNSPKQLGEVLFGKMNLPSGKKTKTGYSTNAEILEKLAPYHPVVGDILEYRSVAKLKSTYVEALLRMVDEDGRIHTSFNQTITATGRLSSTEPNLQNIPIRTALGREMRKFFVSKSDDYVLIDADYSQIELRLLAAISDDRAMLRAFREGTDIHTVTASEVFGVPMESVTPELRKRAKAVNFGIVYGISDFSLSQDIGVTKAQAGRYIESYLHTYEGIAQYLKNIVIEAKHKGYVETLCGRKRHIPEIFSPKKMIAAFGERVAMNSPIQGTAADIIKIAMVKTRRRLDAAGIDARLILQVHDELIIESHRSCAEKAAALLREEMENALPLPVALSVEIGMGRTWYDCK